MTALARAWFFSRQACPVDLSWTIRWTMPRWFSKTWALSRLIAWRSSRSRALSALPSSISLSTPRSDARGKQRGGDHLDAGAALVGDLHDIGARCRKRWLASLRASSAGTPCILELAPALLHLLEIARRHCLRQHGIDLGEAVAIFADELLQALVQLLMAQEPHRGPAQQELQLGIELVLQGARDLRIEPVDHGIEGEEIEAVARRREGRGDIGRRSRCASPMT